MALLFLSGCAGPRSVTLLYPPVVKRMGVPLTPPPPSPIRDTILMGSFSDSRPTPGSVGINPGALGQKTDPVIAANDVPAWIWLAVTHELRQRGIAAIDSADSSASHPNLSLDLITLKCAAYWNYEAEATVAARLSSADSTVLNKRYYGYGNVGPNLSSQPQEFGRVMGIALRDAVTRLAADVGAVLTGAQSAAAATGHVAQMPDTCDSLTTQIDSLAHCNAKVMIIAGQREMSAVRASLFRCDSIARILHAKRTALNPMVQGDVVMMLVVAKNGKVTESRIVRSELKDGLLEQQIAERIRAFEFPRLRDNRGAVTLLYTVSLKKASGLSRRFSAGAVLAALAAAVAIVTIARQYTAPEY
jgi:hypothetical protein